MPFARSIRRHGTRGFALGELIISTAIFSSVSAGLILGFVSLRRNYEATSDFAMNHGDQMRISDYLALDFRRAIAVVPAQNDTTIYIPAYYTPGLAGERDISKEARNPVLDSKGKIFYGPTPQAKTTAALPSCVYTNFTAGAPAKLRATGAGALTINGYNVVPGDTVFVAHQGTETQNGLYTVNTSGSAAEIWELTAIAVKVRYYLAGSIIYRNQEGDANQPAALARDVQDFVFKPSDLGKVITSSITFEPKFRASGASEHVKTATAFHNTTLLRNNRGVY
ncbi:MAG: hypothetical protein AVDCRST_MAG42-2789 [uncultured Chthoniobacterales bacterium]|uniref:Uncharacterized protein n=1 Tax=uncultured Chthoniobacterales bacterium TaxID=1836801 RepID=A0A6J4IX75_9BACT|nr:MAG: hypothetical protein AVDCRST_MAG42-2789 [uncultured Chthoniobacterales bacterium]